MAYQTAAAIHFHRVAEGMDDLLVNQVVVDNFLGSPVVVDNFLDGQVVWDNFLDSQVVVDNLLDSQVVADNQVVLDNFLDNQVARGYGADCPGYAEGLPGSPADTEEVARQVEEAVVLL